MILFSESAGRFIVTIAPENKNRFEEMFQDLPYSCIGTVTEESDPLRITGIDDKIIVSTHVQDLKNVWKQPFGDLI